MTASNIIELRKSKFGKDHIGLREAVGDAVVDFCNYQPEFRDIEDANLRYRAFFKMVEEQTGCSGIVATAKKEAAGAEIYSGLVRNWQKSPKSNGFKSMGDRGKALIVFHYFRDCHRRLDGKGNLVPDKQIGLHVEKQLDHSGGLLERRQRESDGGSSAEKPSVKGLPSDKSGNDLEKATLKVLNRSDEAISVFWLDFMGVERFYFDLRPSKEFLQPTFISHAWVIRRTGSSKKIATVIMDSTSKTVEVRSDCLCEIW